MKLDYELLEEPGFLVVQLELTTETERKFADRIARREVTCGLQERVEFGQFMHGKYARIWPRRDETFEELEARLVAVLRSASLALVSFNDSVDPPSEQGKPVSRPRASNATGRQRIHTGAVRARPHARTMSNRRQVAAVFDGASA